jgi:uncharacterized repeat protein (TIGR01451 family)
MSRSSLPRFSFAAMFAIVCLAMLAIVFGPVTAHPVQAAAFTVGNIVVYRVGDGSAALGNGSTAVFLDEYTSSGTLVQSIALPTTTSGTQKPLTASGNVTTEGFLTRSTDGRYLVLAGYARDAGVSGNVATTASATVNRTIGRVDANGGIDTSTALTDFASGSSPRGVASVDGSSFWVSGGTGGIRYTTFGATTSTQLSTTETNLFATQIFNNQLYVATSFGLTIRVGSVGTGTPTTTGQTITNLPGIPTNFAPYSYFFADLSPSVAGIDTLYVTDNNARDIRKYSLVAGNWTANGVAGGGGNAYRGLTGLASGNTVTLYATRGDTLVSLVDASGHNGAITATPTLLVAAGANTAFRGVALAPEGAETNAAPTLDALANLNLNEDAGAQTVNLSGISDGNAGLVQTLTITATSSNPALIPNPVVTYTSPSTTGSLAFTPAANGNGSATITVRVTDNGSNTAPNVNFIERTFVVNVAAINDAPAASNGALVATEDTAATGTLSATDAESDPLTYAIVANGTSGVATITNPATGAYSYTPNPNANGNDSFTFQAFDDLALDYDGINDYAIAPLNGTTLTQLTVEMWLRPTATANKGIFQWANGLGSPVPFVYFFDNNGTFSLYVNGDYRLTTPLPLNTFSHIAVTHDGTVWRLYKNSTLVGSYTGGRTHQPGASGLYFGNGYHGYWSGQIDEARVWNVARSQAEIATAMLTPLVGNETGLLSYHRFNDGPASATAVNRVSGGPVATLTNMNPATDWVASNAVGGGGSNIATINVTINSVNDAPSLNSIAALNINEDAGAQTVNLAGIDDSDPELAQTLTITATSSNPALIPAPVVTYTSPNATGSLAFTPAANGNGSATITVRVTDNGSNMAPNVNFTERTFVVNVAALNDAPTLNAITNLNINENAGTQTVNLAGIADGDPELAQTLTITATSSNPALVPTPAVTYTSPNTTGSLAFTPAANANGTATITVRVTDNGSGITPNFNYFERTFTVTVNSVNTAPTLDALANQTISGATVVNLAGIGDGDADLTQNLTVIATSSNTAVVPNPVVTYTNPNATGSITLNPAGLGTATITVRVTDSGNNMAPNVNFFERTFVVNVVPTLTVGGNRAYTENAGAVVISPTLTIAAPGNLTAARVVLGTGFVASEDRLGVQGAAGLTGTTNGIAWAYNATTGVMTLNNSRPATDYQALLRLVTYTNLSETPTTTPRIVSFAIGDMLPNDANERFYRYVGGNITWLNARTGAASVANQRFGMTGYLATITSAQENSFLVSKFGNNNTWVGAADHAAAPVNGTNKIWRWVTGPEGLEDGGLGRFFFRQRNDNNATAGCGNGAATSQPVGQYTNWSANEPNDYNGNAALRGCAGQEDFAVMTNLGTWNDAGVGNQSGYYVEYGGMASDPTLQISGKVTINITAANDAPVNTVPAAQTINEDTARVFNTANANLISIADVDASTNPVRVTLDATNGTISLAGTAGLTFGPGDGSADATMTFTGTITAINTALNGLSFTLTANAGGTATLQITTNDLGNTPAPAASDTDTVTINITPINDAPTFDALATLDLNEDAPQQTVNLSGISDGDAESTQSLVIAATSNNPALIPNPTVQYTSANPTGSLTFTPVANAIGTATITVRVTDNGSNMPPNVNFFERTFAVNVAALNDAPTLDALNNLALNEDAAQQAVALTGIADGDSDLAQTLTITATSSDPALIPAPTVAYTSPNATGSLTFTPTANANGTATITVRVTDNGNGTAPNLNFFERSFTVTINAVNDAPTLAALNPLNLNEDAAQQTVALAGIADGDPELNQTLVVTATSSNQALVPNPAVIYTSGDPTGSLQFTPAANANGSATITVRITDEGSNATPNVNFIERTFVVTVAAVNDAPTLDALNDLNLEEDAAQQTIALAGIADGDPELAQLLAITATSSNPALVPDPTVTYTSANPTGSIQFTPAANSYGQATITVRVTDNGSSADPNINFFERTFVVTIAGVPDGAPAATNATTLEDTQTSSGLVLSAPDAVTSHFQITAITGGTLFLQDGSTAIANGAFITLAQGAAGLRFTPDPDSIAPGSFVAQQANGNGAAGLGGSTTGVTVTVTPVNDLPALDALNDLLIDEDAAAQTVALSGILAGPASAGDEATQTLSVTVTSSNPALIAPLVQYTSAETSGSLVFTPTANLHGTALITVRVADSGGTANGGVDVFERSLTVTVNAVNDGPTNALPGPQDAIENTDLLIAGLGVADIDAGSGSLSVNLGVVNGRLSLDSNVPGGLSPAGIVGNNSANLALNGTLEQINATLAAGLTYRSNIGFEGDDTLTMVSNDNGNSGGGGPLSDSDTLIISVASSADLRVTISDTPDPVVAGANLNYTVTVHNAGPSVALGSLLDLALSAGVSLVSATPSTGTCSGNLLCQLGDLPVGAEVTVAVQVTVDPASRGVLSAGATISSNTPDQNRADNQASAITAILGDVNLELSKSATPQAVSAGEPLTYTLAVRNNGASASLGVVLTDTLPTAFTITDVTASQGNCAGIETIGCSLGTINSGASATVTIVGTLDQAARGELLNSASVSSDEGLTTFTALVSPIVARAELAVSKQASAGSATPGGTLGYSISVTNNGPALATGVVLSDTLPVGTSLLALGAGGLTCAASTCTVGELPVGASATITLAVVIDPTARGSLVNTASASAVEASLASSSVSTPLTPVADLSILSLSADTSPVGIGNTLRYEVVVRNDGPSSALAPQVAFTLPANLSFVSAANGIVCTGTGSVRCVLPALDPAATATLSIEARAATAGVARTTAEVQASENDPAPDNNRAEVSINVLNTAVYLPMLFVDARLAAPDLVVEAISTSNGQIEVVIRNQGDAAASDAFWVDLYINPTALPTGPNQTWPLLSQHGMAWGITAGSLPLQPGASLTLRPGDGSYVAELSNPINLLPGMLIAVQVDSAAEGLENGAIAESHELAGEAYNNVTSVVVTEQVGMQRSAGNRSQTGNQHSLPRR